MEDYMVSCPPYLGDDNEQFFQEYCPEGFQIVNISGCHANKKKYSCIWEVYYRLVGQQLFNKAEGNRVFNLVDTYKPRNTNLLDYHIKYFEGKAVWAFRYGVICQCDPLCKVDDAVAKVETRI